jgi:hypothetical protein
MAQNPELLFRGEVLLLLDSGLVTAEVVVIGFEVIGFEVTRLEVIGFVVTATCVEKESE